MPIVKFSYKENRFGDEIFPDSTTVTLSITAEDELNEIIKKFNDVEFARYCDEKTFRKLVSIDDIIYEDVDKKIKELNVIKTSTIDINDYIHNFSKTNLSSLKDNYGYYDSYECTECGIKVKRYGFSRYIKVRAKLGIIKMCSDFEKFKREIKNGK